MRAFRLLGLVVVLASCAPAGASMTPVEWCVANGSLSCEGRGCCAIPSLLPSCGADPTIARMVCESSALDLTGVAWDGVAAAAFIASRRAAIASCSIPDDTLAGPFFTPLLHPGDACNPATLGGVLGCIGDGAYCNAGSNRCDVRHHAGETCDPNTICDSGTYCDSASGRCVAQVPDGLFCSENAACASFNCDATTSTCQRARDPLPDGAACDPFADTCTCPSHHIEGCLHACVNGLCRSLSTSDAYYCQ